jgi:hypothetical protein
MIIYKTMVLILFLIAISCKTIPQNSLVGTWDHDGYIIAFTDKTFEDVVVGGIWSSPYSINNNVIHYIYEANGEERDAVFRIENDILYFENQKYTRRNFTTLFISDFLNGIESGQIGLSNIRILKNKKLKNADKDIIGGGWSIFGDEYRIAKYDYNEFRDGMYDRGKYYIVIWYQGIEKAFITKKPIPMDSTFVKLSINDFEAYENKKIEELLVIEQL